MFAFISVITLKLFVGIMSNHVLPMLYFNLGGEMLYVLDQRLRAQKVSSQKGNKVMCEIVTTMFNSNFMEELFKPQPMYSRKALRSLFEKLVHSSIMRVDTDSMEKLYDLMVMTFKHQIVRCPHPNDLLQITLNHFDAILQFVASKSDAKDLVEANFRKTVELYENMSIGDLVLVKQTLLVFLHDSKSKVSIFVNNGSQNRDGTFVIPTQGDVAIDTNVPGSIKYLSKKNVVENFVTGCEFSAYKIQDASTDIGGARNTRLGMNLYAHDYGKHNPSVQQQRKASESGNQNLAKAELKLLSHLIGASNKETREHFKLDLFDTKEENVTKVTTSPRTSKPDSVSNVLEIKATKSNKGDLSKIMDDFDATPSQSATADEMDLLSLMDNA